MFTNMLTMGQVVLLDPKSIVHAYGHVCKPAHKAIIHKIIGKLGKFKQAMRDVVRGP